MGGKALGLAFMASQLKKNSWLQEKYPRLDIAIPPTLVITTDGFHAFMRDNDLATDFKHKSDTEIAAIFLRASMPAWLENQIGTFLHQVHEPLSVRSSSLLEDALYRPLAGLFETYMLPNNADHATRLQQLVKAVKLVFASTFYAGPRAFYSELLPRGKDESGRRYSSDCPGIRQNSC